MTAAKMMHKGSRLLGRTDEYFRIFRKALSHFSVKKILPYLVLTGPVEIDESKINHTKFKCMGTSVLIRWMFGMYCRATKIMIVYCIKDKSIQAIVPVIKLHVMRAGTILSDSHSAYCNLNTGISKLSQYGFYHMWTNHSFRMIHEKFPFNHTLNVERGWSDVKKVAYEIRYQQNYEKIQEHLNSYILRKRIVKKRRIYDFTLRCIH
jgi:hypothetical protein